MCHRKVDNKGFSMVEILVSIVILGIVFVPLTKNFIVAMHANAKAKVMQQAATVGQSVMEDFKAEKLQKLKDSYILTEGTLDSTAVYEKDVTTGSQTFHAKITVSNCKAENNGVDKINQKKLAKIYTMDSVSSCIYQIEELPEWIVEAYQKEKAPSESLDFIRNNMTRTYQISVTDNGGSGAQSVSLTTIYQVGSNGEYEDTDGITKDMPDGVKNIYVYLPVADHHDTVRINAPGGLSANLYLIKTSVDTGTTAYAEVPDGMKDKVKSNISYYVKEQDGANHFYFATDVNLFLTDMEEADRRYSIQVEIFDEKHTDKLYAKMNSTRGKDA